MIGFRKWRRLLHERRETITTRYELNKAGRLVEHVTLETNDRRTGIADTTQVDRHADRRRTPG